MSRKLDRIIKETIRDFLNEQIEEDRTEFDDGSVEVDNFNMIAGLMNKQDEDKVYFVQILSRHKDNPQFYYPENATSYITYYVFRDAQEMMEKKDEIKSICQKLNARAYIYLNPRIYSVAKNYAETRLKDLFSKHEFYKYRRGHEMEVALGQSKDDDINFPNRNICFVDVDSDDEDKINKVKEIIAKAGIKPIGAYRSLNNGIHIILPNKNDARKLDFSEIDGGKRMGRWSTASLEIDKSVILYCKISSPKGYGVQQRMQNRIAGKQR